MSRVKALEWVGDALRLLDQRVLPLQERYLECRTVDEVIHAIRAMVVRGAPAIGIAAAYGAVLSEMQHGPNPEAILQDLDRLAAARPTAVNLAWALALMRREVLKRSANDLPVVLLTAAQGIHREDLEGNYEMARLGAEVLATSTVRPFAVLTHCNTGSLATSGHGTALGVIRSAWQQGLISQVHADETRPWLQGSRLTAWELRQDGIPVSLNADAAAGWLMAQGKVKWVIVGADRITSNGDVANKIGTYGLAVLARHHKVKFMVVAPSSTIDLRTPSGSQIEIEHRNGSELTKVMGQLIAPENVGTCNPVFDVTPAALVDVLVTEKGVVWAPDARGISALMALSPERAQR